MGTVVDINKYKTDVVNGIVKHMVSAAEYLDDAKSLNHLNSKNLLLDAVKKEMQQCLNNIHILERMLYDMEFKKEITDAHCKYLMRECGFIDPSEYDLPSNREPNKHKFAGADAIDCMMDRIKDDDCADAFDEFAKTIEIVKASDNEKRLSELEQQFEAVGFKDAKKAAQLAVDKINRDEADIKNAIAVEFEKITEDTMKKSQTKTRKSKKAKKES